MLSQSQFPLSLYTRRNELHNHQYKRPYNTVIVVLMAAYWSRHLIKMIRDDGALF